MLNLFLQKNGAVRDACHRPLAFFSPAELDRADSGTCKSQPNQVSLVCNGSVKVAVFVLNAQAQKKWRKASAGCKTRVLHGTICQEIHAS